MRLAFIASNRTNANGGSEELWSKTALYALQEGHEVACVVFDWEESHYLLDGIKAEGATIITRRLRGPNRPLLSRIFSKLNDLFRIKIFGADYEFKQLKSWKPDMICLSQGAVYDHVYRPTYQVLFRKMQVPYFVLAHSYKEGGFLPKWHRERSINVLSNAERVLLVAEKQRRVIQKELFTVFDNVSIVRNPLNLTDFKKVSFPESEKLLMATVGSLTIRWKGHDILLEALSRDVWADRNWELSIYGSGNDLAGLKDLVHFYGLSDKVVFKGHVSDVRGIWSEQQVLIMPSRIEAAPLTVCEAMICGRAVVTTDIGDMATFFEDNVSGFLAPAPDEKYLNEALERLWARKGDLSKMGESAHQEMAQVYSENPESQLLDIMISE